MEGASTWKAPLDAPVSRAMRSPQTRRAAEVLRCSTLLGACKSSLQHLSLCMPTLNFPKACPTLCQNLSLLHSLPTYESLAYLPCRIPYRTQWPVSDVDECASRASCPTGLCLNTEGSFTCSACQSGYWVNEDGTACEGNRRDGDRGTLYRPPSLLNSICLSPALG